MLIVIEGLDGSGKGTQSQLLVEKLKEEGHKVRKVSFPDYGSPSSTLVKMYLEGEFGSHPSDVNAYSASSFYAVDRFASFKKDWQDDWRDGIVVADRYTTSNAIHQCSKLPRKQWDSFLNWLFDFEYIKLGIPEPDLVVYLRVDPSVSRELIKARGRMQDIHEKDEGYLVRCREAADYCAEKLNWKTIECIEDSMLRTIDDIGAEIVDLVNQTIR